MDRIIYVHGTYAGTKKFNGLSANMAASGLSNEDIVALRKLAGKSGAELYSYGWSGDDTRHGRVEGSLILGQYLAALNGITTIVTHSHGGNVLGYALLQGLTPGQRKNIRAYLFACPIMSGPDSAWTQSLASNLHSIRTFSHPHDYIQVQGAKARNAVNTGTKLGYGVGYTIPGVINHSINPGGFLQSSAHSAMHSAEAFKMALIEVGKNPLVISSPV